MCIVTTGIYIHTKYQRCFYNNVYNFYGEKCNIFKVVAYIFIKIYIMSINKAFIKSVEKDIQDQKQDWLKFGAPTILTHNNESYSYGITYECDKCETELVIDVDKKPVDRQTSICPNCKDKRMLNSVYVYEN